MTWILKNKRVIHLFSFISNKFVCRVFSASLLSKIFRSLSRCLRSSITFVDISLIEIISLLNASFSFSKCIRSFSVFM